MRLRRILTAVVVGLGCVAWTVAAAAAGNPHGSGSAQANGKGSDRANAKVHGHAKAKGHGNASASAHGNASVSAGAGVKPSSSSGHWTVAAASSTQTKLYGNGQTAGQIAMGAGASGDTVLYGPGNSQPHKVLCARQMVDVHALKAHGGVCGGAHGSAFTQMHGRAKLFVHPPELIVLFGLNNSTAIASSNQTKVYGNGQTAGQIAIQAGLSGNTVLYGSGNSRPHKVLCGAKLIDVHALKARASACMSGGGAAGVGTNTSTGTNASAGTQGHVSFTGSARSKLAGHAGVQGAAAAKAKPRSGGGVLGATARVAGATKSRGAAVFSTVRKGTGTLPFTGLALWLPAAIGLALVATGIGARRKAARLQ